MTLFILTVLTAGLGAPQKAKDVEEEWRRNYPLAAKHFEEMTQKFSCTGNLSRRSFKGKVLVTKNIKFVKNGNKILLIRDNRVNERGNRPVDTDVLCLTNQHAFRLTKQGETSPYVVETYAQPERWKGIESQFSVLFDIYMESPYVVLGKPFLKQMEDPSFKLKGIKSIENGGEALVRIDYSLVS